MARFTVLLPVVRSPELIPFAIRSVQAQTVSDFTLMVICDGAPEATAQRAEEFAETDRRIRVLPFPKGPGNGEVYRDFALSRADSDYVAQIADDDLWMPDHLAELGRLLQDVEFGHLLQTDILPSGEPMVLAGDISSPAVRRTLMEQNTTFFGPTVTGYRLASYRALPARWTPAPPGIGSDVHMWRKFFAAGVVCGSRFAIESVKLSSAWRRGASPAAREPENAAWFERLGTEAGRADFRARAWQRLFLLGNRQADP